MKQILSLFLLFGITIGLYAQDNCMPLFPKVQLTSLDSLIEGDWFYQYSFDSDSAFIGFEEKIDFYPSSKKTNKYTSNNKRIHAFRSSSSLEKLEYFEGYKGIACYPKLRSDSTDSQGNLIKCYIDLMMKGETDVEFGEEPDLNIISLTDRIMVLKKKNTETKRIEYLVFAKQ